MSQDNFEAWRRHLETDTRTATQRTEENPVLEVPGLTLLAHPDPHRVGEEALWPDLAIASGTGARAVAELSRLDPEFVQPTGGLRRPLADPRLSRNPILCSAGDGGGLILETGESRTRVEVNGEVVKGRRELAADELARGAVLLLGGRIVLLLHRLRLVTERPPSFGLVGESPAMLRLRWEIERLKGISLPVLLRGASGTGKELVAKALEHHGPTSGGPFLSLNMAAIPPTLAAAELFGAARGAHSGARQAQPGYFQRADGGTLFLDEIGELPVEVQGLLLRVLESGEIQPLGSETPRRVRVRVIAATDADLETAIAEGRFRAPLLHRLSSYEIRLPLLRERRADIGRLFFHFLALELEALGESKKLESFGPFGTPWVSAALVAALAAYDWPGNVRQLKNVVSRLVVGQRQEPTLKPVDWLVEMLGLQAAPGAVGASHEGAGETERRRRAPAGSYQDPSKIDDEELLRALRAHSFDIKPTAEALGISRTSLYGLVDRCPGVRKAADLEEPEIEASAQRHDGNIVAMAAELEVSKQGLKRRMQALGLR